MGACRGWKETELESTQQKQKRMGEEPLGALLKGKDLYQGVERGMLKFQVTGSCSRSEQSVKQGKYDIGEQDCVIRERELPCEYGSVSPRLHGHVR